MPHPLIAAERARKREQLLAAIERSLAGISERVERGTLHGADQIGLAAGPALKRYRVKKHFEVTTTDTTFTYERKLEQTEATRSTQATPQRPDQAHHQRRGRPQLQEPTRRAHDTHPQHHPPLRHPGDLRQARPTQPHPGARARGRRTRTRPGVVTTHPPPTPPNPATAAQPSTPVRGTSSP
jgi:hypothetical protein